LKRVRSGGAFGDGGVYSASDVIGRPTSGDLRRISTSSVPILLDQPDDPLGGAFSHDQPGFRPIRASLMEPA
jgi:hypothetical protein